MRRVTDIIKGLAALAFTIGLVAGIPYLLVTYVGWPLPTEIPSWEVIERTVTQTGIDQVIIIKTLAVVVWVTWAQLVWALAVETIAAIRGRVARRTDTLPGLQLVAARLVATASLIITSLGPVKPALAAPLGGIDVPPPTAHVLVVNDPAIPASIDSVVASEAEAAASGPTYTVRSVRDSYWSIAEETLSDGRRWVEIRDLNAGRTMGDGTVLAASHEDIRPGWKLMLPADAVLPMAAYEAAEVEVESGDNQWVIAEEHLEDVLERDVTDAEVSSYWRDVVDANQDNIRSGDPDLIYEGETLELSPVADTLSSAAAAGAITNEPEPPIEEPVEPATEPEEATTADASLGETETTAGTVEVPNVWVDDDVTVDTEWLSAGPEGELAVEPDEPIAGDVQMWVTEEVAASIPESADPFVVLPAAAAAAAAVTGAVAAGAWWHRRRRLEPVDAPPDTEVVDTTDENEHDLPAEVADDRGLWAVGAALEGLRGTPPTPLVAVVDPHITRVVVPGVGDRTPRGWTLSEKLTDVWEVPTSAIGGRYVASAAAATPGLVRVGANSDDEMLWVNVEAAMVVAVDGATPHVAPVLAAWARRLVGRTDTIVTWIGDHPPQGCSPADIDSVIGSLSAAPKPPSTSVATRRLGTSQPLAVIVAADVPAPQRARLTAAVSAFGSDRGVALLTSWDTPDAAPEFRWSMPAYGTLDIPSMVTPVTVDGLATPVAEVIELEARPAPAVELQVLGPPRLIINDEEPQLRRSQSIELLAYLVTHPKGASTDKLLDVLFPNAENQRAKRPTLQQLSTEIRKLVGLELLPRARDGWYRTEVTSDEQRFTLHVADADAAGNDTERAAHLREALNLVRGRPFDTSADWMWAMTDGIVTTAMQRLHDAAHQLATLEINLGHYDAADDVAAKGILADPHCDRCWELRLQAAEAAGNDSHVRHLEEQRHRIAEAS